ncbi:MAG: GAF domain-containing protein [Gemmataceae bacterium]|nr:GAF domain-containing protein [Gemmataceae bacterium]
MSSGNASAAWEVDIFENFKSVFNVSFVGTLELGRQDRGEPAPYGVKAEGKHTRLVIAYLEEDRVPRRYLRIDPQPNGTVTITNLSPRVPIRMEQGPLVKPDGQLTLPPPLTLLIEHRAVRVQPSSASAANLQSLPDSTMAPFQHVSLSGNISSIIGKGEENVTGVVRWLQAAMGVLQSAAGSSDFFQRAARAVVDLVGLDSCRVLLREQGAWRMQALQTAEGVPRLGDAQGSRHILDKILQEKRTFWELPSANFTASLMGVKALVAAPILSPQGDVIGVLYGDRSSKSDGLRPITHIEALLVELLASGVAAGLARVEQEQAALRAQVTFQQYFTPRLSRRLADNPELLDPRDEEVSVLFCDIRAFSRITERLGTKRTVNWIGDVLGVLSECVMREEGTLVDYVGDELMAIWGAPDEQPDHARRACRAGLDMLAQLPALNQRWQTELSEPIRVGIGINSGVASVGNIGSHIKFKYGPRGTIVNVASRVQGANKFWKTSLLVTGSTHAQLDGAFGSRRLGAVRVVNIAEPVTLHEVVPPGLAPWPKLERDYEAALAHFEKQEFRETVRVLGNLLPDYPDDGPTFVLMARAVQCLVDEPETFDPVWSLPGK